VVGATVATDGGLAPAVWASPDGGASFEPVPMDPHTFYGRQNLLYTVGCRDGRIAAVGAKSGGAHGNPRVATWYQRADRSLTEVEASFEMYGGNDHVGVSHIAGGPAGWLIAGNRVSGASVWVSADATEFELVEYGAGPVSGITGATSAADLVADPAGWIVVGCVLRPGRTGRDAAAWSSPDGRAWTAVTVPSADDDDALQRIGRVDGGLLAVGVRGAAFGAWTSQDGRTWAAAGGFGRSRGQVAPGVSGIATLAGRVLVATEAAAGRQLWASDRTGRAWTSASLPPAAAAVAAGGDTALTVADGGGVVLLVADDGRVGGVWRVSGR
jgi:hypothetical protein